MPARLAIDIRGNVLQMLPLNQAGNAARELDHLDPALHAGPGLGQGLTMLARDQRRQLFEMLSHQLAKAKHQRARSTTGVSAQSGSALAAA